MDFFQDYWTYHQCYEIPRNYALWSGIGLVSAVMHKKLLYCHAALEIHAPMFIGLIGPQGNSKSTSNNFSCQFFQEAVPDANIGPSRTSPEKVAELMASDDYIRTFTNWRGEATEVRPCAFFINEFKNFVGRSPMDMINFLTDIYDVKVYRPATIIRGVEMVVNPALTITMCETPEWFIRNIRGDIITGGIGRRFVLVYEIEDAPPKPIPIITPEAFAAEARIKQRLKEARTITGQFQWEPKGKALYEKWYYDNYERRRKEQNQMMRGYLRSKHIQAFKTMMCFDAVSDKPMFLFTADLFDLALAHLDPLERNMPKLSLAAGRNDMMAAQLRLIDILESGWNGEKGWMPKKLLLRAIESELTPMEQISVIRYLSDTDQIVERDVNISPTAGQPPVQYKMIMLPWKYNELTKPKQ